MKKLLAALLAACLLLSGLTVAFAQQEAVVDTLPQVGDVVEGFQVVEIMPFALIDATIVRFEHVKTGAELYYIANQDTNRAFDLAFRTQVIDQTGLPHVFEHSTLGGSARYPSKSLFFNLSYQTYNTYMNAITSSLYTQYPVGSLSEAQLLRYADFYTDSCFNPMIMWDESIYREEAWRYRLESADAPLTIEGTVYSEMLGAYTKESAAYFNAMGTLFPGSYAGNVNGGQPDYIPDMTWDALKAYHDTYYHPSNCIAYLYGSFEDYTAFLTLLDGYFSQYDRAEIDVEDVNYTPLTESVEAVYAYPVTADSTARATAYYAVLCPDADEQTRMVLNTLTDLLVEAGSPLYQALRQALPGGTFSAYVNDCEPDFAVIFCMQDIDQADVSTFVNTVNDVLGQIAETGFDQELVDGCEASLELSIRLLGEEDNVGIEVAIANLLYCYTSTGDPWNYLDYIDALGNMDDWNQQGLYAQAIADYLLSDPITALAVTVPQPGLREEKDAALAQALADVKAAMTDEEIAALVAQTNAPAEEDDASQYVAQLQAVTVDSLPEEVVEYDVYDETDDNGIRHIDVVAGVDGIGQTNILLDASGIPTEGIHWFKLYVDLLGEMDTTTHTRAELATLVGRYLYDVVCRVSLPGSAHNYHPYLRMGWTATDDDLAAGYDLVYELLYESDFTDVDRIAESVQGLAANLKNSITNAPYNMGLYRILSQRNELDAYYNYANFLDYYTFLQDVADLLDADPDTVVANLQYIQSYFNNSTGAVLTFAGNEDSIALNRGIADAFMARLDSADIEPQEYTFPEPAESEALIIDSNVQYNILAIDYDALGLEGYPGDLDALTSLVADTYLYPLLRDQYGAYSVFHYISTGDCMYIISYRDPNVLETYAVYASLPDLVAQLDVDQDTLDGYILSSYSYYAMPVGALSGAAGVAMDTVIPDEADVEVTDIMRDLKAMTPEKVQEYASLYATLVEQGSIFTAGSAASINANADLFDAIYNPFGSVDMSQVEFADVAEDSPYYPAVRFAFENGLMDPISDDAFGVDDDACLGDLLGMFYALVGGDLNPEEAVAFFAEYGLVAADADIAAPITMNEATALTTDFTTLIGYEYDGIAADEDHTMNRGDMAAFITDYIEWLET